jgi:hypothetical protein
LDFVYNVAKALDMPEGDDIGEQLMPALVPAPVRNLPDKPSPFSEETNQCKECQVHICTGKGMLNGAGKACCICFNDNIPFPANASKTNIAIVKTYRAVIKLEPSKTDIKTTTPKEAYIILKAHRATQNDLSGRFNGPNPSGTRQQSTPFQAQSDQRILNALPRHLVLVARVDSAFCGSRRAV